MKGSTSPLGEVGLGVVGVAEDEALEAELRVETELGEDGLHPLSTTDASTTGMMTSRALGGPGSPRTWIRRRTPHCTSNHCSPLIRARARPVVEVSCQAAHSGRSRDGGHTPGQPTDLVRPGGAALALPVLRQFLAMPQVTLPLAGVVYNLGLDLGHDGVVGIKTGTDAAAGGPLSN